MGLRWGELDCEDPGEPYCVFDLHLEASREAEKVIIRLILGGQWCGGGNREEGWGLREEGAAWQEGEVQFQLVDLGDHWLRGHPA